MPSYNIMKALAAAVVACSTATALAEATVPLEIYWSLPIQHSGPGDPDGKKDQSNLLLSVTTSGLALTGTDTVGTRRLIRLRKAPPTFTELRVPETALYGIAETPDGGVLVTGEVHHWYLEELLKLSGRSADAVAARIAADGTPLWSRQLGGPGMQVGVEIVALASGGSVVLGSDGSRMPVWGLGADGSLIWERTFDRYGGAISALPDDRVAVVGGAVHGSGNNFREDAMLWIIDGTGKELSETTMRTGINNERGSHYERFFVASNQESIVALSGVTSRFAPTRVPLELAKYDLQGQLVWSVEVRRQDCDTEPFVLPGGDVLHACAEPHREGTLRLVTLSRYAAEDGTVASSSAILPKCQHSITSVVVRVIGTEADHAMLVGSRPRYNVGQSCTWAGQMPLPRLRPASDTVALPVVVRGTKYHAVNAAPF